ncbi:MAG: hypothetical protein ACLQDY_15670 [Streptosporangiaceae bacterium]
MGCPAGRLLGYVLAALDTAGPEPGRLAAIRGVLAAFDWEHDDRQYALERIEQIAGSSPVAPAADPGGTATVGPADLPVVLGALEDAAELLEQRAAHWCEACETTPAECDLHQADLDAAGRYRALASTMGGAR